MLFPNLVLFFFLHINAWLCAAYPNPSPLLHPLDLNLVQNLTLALPTSSRTFCYEDGARTTVAGCRPVLNYMKGFANYKLIQPFQEGRCPTIPGDQKPPLLLFAKTATCAIEIASQRKGFVDAFSFEEVRTVATEVVEECQNSGGFGGSGALGRGMEWRVRIIGVDAGHSSQGALQA